MKHWLLSWIDERRAAALQASDRIINSANEKFHSDDKELDVALIFDIANALEMAVMDLISEESNENENLIQSAAGDAFKLFKTFFISNMSTTSMDQGKILLRASCLASIGNQYSSAVRWLRELEDIGDWPDLPIYSENWGDRMWATIIDVWLRLFRDRGSDRDIVIERIANLRSNQIEAEKKYLYDYVPVNSTKASAFELIGLYHLAKSAEIIAKSNHDDSIRQLLDIDILNTHFRYVTAVCGIGRLIELELIVRLLAPASDYIVHNSCKKNLTAENIVINTSDFFKFEKNQVIS